MDRFLKALAIAALAVAYGGPAKAILIDATIVTDTATEFEAFVTDTSALGGSLFTLTGTHWQIDVRKGSLAGGGTDNDVQIFNAVHLIPPNPGEAAPYFIPQLAPMMFVDVTAGTDGSPITLGFGANHPGGSDQDAVLARYEAFGPAGESRLSIRLYHGEGGQALTEAVTLEVPEPATLAVFGIGLAGLGFARRRRRA